MKRILFVGAALCGRPKRGNHIGLPLQKTIQDKAGMTEIRVPCSKGIRGKRI